MLNFEDSKKIGEEGEYFAWLVLRAMNYKVLDVRNFSKYQKEDVDFLVDKNISNVGNSIKVEVKTDTIIHRTGNIFVEYSIFYSNEEKEFWVSQCDFKNNGWLLKSSADFIMYYDKINRFFYFIKKNQLQEYLKDNEKLYPFKTLTNEVENSFIYGKLIPINDLINKNICHFGFKIERIIKEKGQDKMIGKRIKY